MIPKRDEFHDGPADGRPVVVLADHDDPDFGPLSEWLEQSGVDVTWLRFGLEDGGYEFHADQEDVAVQVGLDCVDDSVIREARLVLQRRWRLSPPRPPVPLRLAGDPESFGEREWTASIDYALWHWSRMSPDETWGNSPRAVQNRLALYQLAREAGLAVPPTWVATTHSSLSLPLVSKAIASDERVHGESYFPATQLDETTIENLNTQRSPCPNLAQTLIPAELEIRVVYCFGVIGAVAQQRVGESPPLDIRYDPEVSRTPYAMPAAVERKVRQVARLSGLNLFTLDVLVHEDTHWVVDLTPAGTIRSTDDGSDTLFTAFCQGILSLLDASPLSLPTQSR